MEKYTNAAGLGFLGWLLIFLAIGFIPKLLKKDKGDNKDKQDQDNSK